MVWNCLFYSIINFGYPYWYTPYKTNDICILLTSLHYSLDGTIVTGVFPNRFSNALRKINICMYLQYVRKTTITNTSYGHFNPFMCYTKLFFLFSSCFCSKILYNFTWRVTRLCAQLCMYMCSFSIVIVCVFCYILVSACVRICECVLD